MNKRYFIIFLMGCASFISAKHKPKASPLWGEVAPTYKAVTPYLVDHHATPQTAALFYNLKSYAKKGTLLGQQDPYRGRKINDSIKWMSDIKLTTHRTPMIVGSGFLFSFNKEYKENPSNWFYQQELANIAQAKESYRQGLINTFCWHYLDPEEKTHFYTKEMSDSEKAIAFKKILKGGANHEAYKKDLRKIARILAALKDDRGKPIPIIFRPFHECTGNWFWWGVPFYATAEEYKQNWRFTVSYLRDSLHVHNVLYAFSPGDGFTSQKQYLECYPGDKYVDIIGFDNYENYGKTGKEGINKVSNMLKIISDIAIAHNKVAALTEFGYRMPEHTVIDSLYTDYMLVALRKEKPEIAYAMYWGNGGDENYYVPTPDTPATASNFLKFVNSPSIFLAGDTRNMYIFPSQKK